MFNPNVPNILQSKSALKCQAKGMYRNNLGLPQYIQLGKGGL